jgi:murein endopeptidase
VLLALLIASPAAADKPRTHVTAHDDAATKARAALAVIDGTTWVEDAAPKRPATTTTSRRDAADARSDAADARRIASRLQPWRATILDGGPRGEPSAGGLDGAERLDEGDGIHVRRPQRAYGEPHVVEYVRHAVAEVRALYPDLPTLAIGDLSSEHGGALPGHVSHKSGRDVDVGFYFHHAVTGFQDASDDLDLDATWALLAAFARTADRKDGVEIIFLDYAVQKRLYAFAKAHGMPGDELAFLFQYPAGKDAMTGLVRHWPNHANHLHVRFKP